MLIEKFVRRLKNIGIDVVLHSNFPWIYLYEVNGKKVKETFMANHGYTVFFEAIRKNDKTRFSNRREVFKLIRKYLEDKHVS